MRGGLSQVLTSSTKNVPLNMRMRTTNIQRQEAVHAPATVNATSPNLEEFRYIIQTYLLPLVCGSVLDGPHRGANMENGPVSFDTAHGLNIAVPGAPDLHMALKRPAPFTEEESALIRHIVALMHAYSLSGARASPGQQ